MRIAVNRFLCFAVFALLLLPGTVRIRAGESSSDAREQWMGGYIKLEEGGKAEETGNLAEALSLYREALEVFQEVRRKYPSWNPSLLGYRTTYCTQRIRRIEAQLAKASADMSPKQLATTVGDQLRKMTALMDENRDLRRKLAITADALERARRESARTVNSEENLKDLMTERAQLKKRTRLQQQQIEQLSREVASLKKKTGIEQAAEKLQGELERTQAREQQLEKAFDTYRKAYENVKEKLKKATIDREKLLRVSRELKDRADTAERNAETARKETDDMRRRLTKLEEQGANRKTALARKEATIADLQKDVERLRAENRELQHLRDSAAGEARDRQRLVEQVQTLLAAKTKAEEQLTEMQVRLDAANKEAARWKNAARTPGSTAKSADADQTARLQQLETTLRETKTALREARTTIDNQKRLLDTQARKLNEAATITGILDEKEKALAAADKERKTLRDEMATRQAALTQAREELHQAQADLRRTRMANKDLELQTVKLQGMLRDGKRQTMDHSRRLEDLKNQLRQTADMLRATEGERDVLRAKSKDQLALLKEQEKALRQLEEEKRALNAAMDPLKKKLQTWQRKVEEQAAAFDRETRTMKAKTEVVDGLTASLSDLDTELETTRKQLAALRREKQQSQQQTLDLQRRLREAQQENKRYVQALASKTTAKEKKLLKQLSELTTRLDKEVKKRQALEEALAKIPLDTATATAPPHSKAPTPTREVSEKDIAEQQRHARERRTLVRGYLRQAVAAEKSGKVEAARWNYAKVLEQDAGNKLAVQRLGLLAAEHGNDDEAIKYLRRAFKLDPDDLATILPLGFALLRRQKADLAVSMLSRAVALEPDNPTAHRCLGIACSSLGWYDAAEVQFHRTAALDPNDGENAFNLAVLLVTRKPPQLKKAKMWYEKALRNGVERDPGLDELFGLGKPAKKEEKP